MCHVGNHNSHTLYEKYVKSSYPVLYSLSPSASLYLSFSISFYKVSDILHDCRVIWSKTAAGSRGRFSPVASPSKDRTLCFSHRLPHLVPYTHHLHHWCKYRSCSESFSHTLIRTKVNKFSLWKRMDEQQDEYDQDLVLLQAFQNESSANGSEISGNFTTLVGLGTLKPWTYYIQNLSPLVIIINVINLIGNLTILCLIRFSTTFRK